MDGGLYWNITRICKTSSCPRIENHNDNIDYFQFNEGEEYTIHFKIWNSFDSFPTPYIILNGTEYRIHPRHSFIESNFLSEQESREYKINKMLES